ncbi:Signal recognition particle, SRP9 subunit [Corchorus capsularis]|uniref:Signal recognition particle 9 kDa protein n=1 Tax=Corchorus capsularis TaxID=210143 RepID=A0A1R3I726_COCAP|nr:Signal recognition particle, SRP9 subunit [Corchorus capsularis]
MVYITSWDEFVERTVQLFRADPESCLKFKTDQAQEAKKMEKLNNIFFTLMARGPDVDMSEITGKEQTEAQPAKKGRGRKQ